MWKIIANSIIYMRGCELYFEVFPTEEAAKYGIVEHVQID
jgi:hypothetical protein